MSVQTATTETVATAQALTYGDHSIDPATLPASTQMALMRRGLAHYLGNEQASKLSTWAKRHADANEGKAPTDEATAAEKARLTEAALTAMREGTIGANVRGPRGTPLEQIMRNIAEKEVRGILKGQGLSMPTGEKKIEFPDGASYTRGDLIDRRIQRDGDRLRKAAEAEVKAMDRLAKGGDGKALADLL